MSRYLQFLREAFNYLHEKRPDLALAALDRAESAYDPNDKNLGVTKEDLYLTRGSIYYEQNNYSAALTAFEKALQENNASSEACAQMGKCLLQLGEIENAKVMLEWAVKYDPFNQKAELLLQKITSALEDGIMAKADDDLLTIAYSDFQKKEFKSALDKVFILEKHEQEKYASILNFKGYIYLATNENELARKNFEEAKRINPDSSQAYTGLGELYYLEGKDAEAKACYEKAISLNKDNHVAAAGLKKTSKSAPATQAISPQRIETLIQTAYDDFENHRFSEATEKITLAETELRKHSDTSPLLLSKLLSFKGTIYMQNGLFIEAKESFEEALAANPESSPACTGLAEIFLQDNKFDAAKVMFEWAIKLNPQNEKAKQGLDKIPV